MTTPTFIRDAFRDRVSLTPAEAARLLRMDVKTLREHVRLGNIRYLLKGVGEKRPRREFTESDLVEFLADQRRQECRSTDPKTRRSSTSTSSVVDNDFMARLAKRRGERPRP